MSWQKRSIQLVLGFPLALPIVTHAVNVGETYIQSGQNEPLNASINVTDIDPKTFSVKVATPEMYKQLGLSDEQAVNAKFEPTSSNGGKIILTTDQPVATPYADVVLNIENKGEKNLLPKTLLMPISGSQQVVTQPQSETAVIERPKIKKTVAKHAQVELPQTTITDINPANVPLVINKEAPPDLAMTSATPVITPPATPALTPIAVEATPVVTTPSPAPVATPAPTTPQSDIPKSDTPKSDTPQLASNTTTAPASNNKFDTYPEPPPITKASKPVVKTTSKSGNIEASEDDTTTYVVQRNDSLWSIASTIAKRDGKNVHQVMQDIIDENPESFENGDPARMIANTELDIPNYSTVPSQASIKNAKRHKTHTVPAQTPRHKTETTPSPQTHKNSAKSVHKKKTYKTTQNTAKTKVQTKIRTNTNPRPARKAQLDIISASQSNGTAQGQHNTSDKGTSSQIIEQVKQHRTATANQASRVNQLSGALSTSEQRLKIQNEKLAMLEKRLKELNSQ